MARTKGSKNKASMQFAMELEALNFSIPQQAVLLFEKLEDRPDLRVRLLEMMSMYSFFKPKAPEPEVIDLQLTNVTKNAEVLPSTVITELVRQHSKSSGGGGT